MRIDVPKDRRDDLVNAYWGWVRRPSGRLDIEGYLAWVVSLDDREARWLDEMGLIAGWVTPVRRGDDGQS